MENPDESLLTLVASGFIGGIAALGRQTLSPTPDEFQRAFSSAWAAWHPARHGGLAQFTPPGRHRMKAVLYRARSLHFIDHRQTIVLPAGMESSAFLRLYAWPASPAEWMQLAGDYVQHHGAKQSARRSKVAPSKADPEERASVARVAVVQANGIRIPGGIIRQSRSKYLSREGRTIPCQSLQSR